EKTQASIASNPRWPLTPIVAEIENVGENSQTRGLVPVVDRWKAFPCKLGVGSGFVPAHATHGKIVLSGRIVAQFPRGGAGPPSSVRKFRASFFPGKHT